MQTKQVNTLVSQSLGISVNDASGLQKASAALGSARRSAQLARTAAETNPIDLRQEVPETYGDFYLGANAHLRVVISPSDAYESDPHNRGFQDALAIADQTALGDVQLQDIE